MTGGHRERKIIKKSQTVNNITVQKSNNRSKLAASPLPTPNLKATSVISRQGHPNLKSK